MNFPYSQTPSQSVWIKIDPLHRMKHESNAKKMKVIIIISSVMHDPIPSILEETKKNRKL